MKMWLTEDKHAVNFETSVSNYQSTVCNTPSSSSSSSASFPIGATTLGGFWLAL
jgi:hypothetical protein